MFEKLEPENLWHLFVINWLINKTEGNKLSVDQQPDYVDRIKAKFPLHCDIKRFYKAEYKL